MVIFALLAWKEGTHTLFIIAQSHHINKELASWGRLPEANEISGFLSLPYARQNEPISGLHLNIPAAKQPEEEVMFWVRFSGGDLVVCEQGCANSTGTNHMGQCSVFKGDGPFYRLPRDGVFYLHHLKFLALRSNSFSTLIGLTACAVALYVWRQNSSFGSKMDSLSQWVYLAVVAHHDLLSIFHLESMRTIQAHTWTHGGELIINLRLKRSLPSFPCSFLSQHNGPWAQERKAFPLDEQLATEPTGSAASSAKFLFNALEIGSGLQQKKPVGVGAFGAGTPFASAV